MNWVKPSKGTREALTTGRQSKRIGDQEGAVRIANGETSPTHSLITKCQQVCIFTMFLKQPGHRIWNNPKVHCENLYG